MPRRNIKKRKQRRTGLVVPKAPKIITRDDFKSKDLSLRCFKRDKFTCRICGKKDQTFEAHHLLPWSWETTTRLDLHNLITVCKDTCHLPKMHNNNPKTINMDLTMVLLIENLNRLKKIANAQAYLLFFLKNMPEFNTRLKSFNALK